MLLICCYLYVIAQHFEGKRLEVGQKENIGKPLPREYFATKDKCWSFSRRFVSWRRKEIRNIASKIANVLLENLQCTELGYFVVRLKANIKDRWAP